MDNGTEYTPPTWPAASNGLRFEILGQISFSQRRGTACGKKRLVCAHASHFCCRGPTRGPAFAHLVNTKSTKARVRRAGLSWPTFAVPPLRPDAPATPRFSVQSMRKDASNMQYVDCGVLNEPGLPASSCQPAGPRIVRGFASCSGHHWVP